MDLTRISMRLGSALRIDAEGHVTGAQVHSIIKPICDAIEGLNKEVISLQKKIDRLETQLQSQHSQPHKSE